ncbi:MAG: NAD(P)-binding domain-containing protein [Chloroflexota bacterium]
MNIAILGLGEAGGIFAAELIKAGATVCGYDPADRPPINRLQRAESNAAAVAQADIVFSINWSSVSEQVAAEVAQAIRPGTFYAEMNTSSPAQKRCVAEILAPTGIHFIDAAIMAPVPPYRLQTPLLISGAESRLFKAKLDPLGMTITVLNETVGDAAGRKLLRSIVYKGIAAVVCEAMEAAEAFGLEGYQREQLASILKEESMIDRFVNGSRKHAARRMHEMEAVVEMLTAAGVRPVTSQAAVESLRGMGG